MDDEGDDVSTATVREEDEDGESSVDTLREVEEVQEDLEGTDLKRRMFKEEPIKEYEVEEAECMDMPERMRRKSIQVGKQ